MDSLLGFMIAMLGQLLMLPGWVSQQQQAVHTTTQITTAQQMAELVSAATPFIQQNLTTGMNLAAAATASSAATITVGQLASANVGLPANFSSINPYGQTWEVQVLQPSAGNFQALVLGVGGKQLTDLAAAGVAADAGAAGGFIPQNDSGIYGAGPGQAIGNQANWSVATAGYHAITGGQPASLIVLDNGRVQNSSLYRVAVPGQPQLNTMVTALDMGGNNVNNAGTVNVQKIVAPGGNSVQIGNSYYYGDTQNSAVRQTGYFAVQHPNGTPADIAEVGSITSSGNLSVSGSSSLQGYTSIGGGATIAGNTTMGANTEIYNPGTEYLEAGGQLYLKPWTGGQTIVGGGGGSGQLVTEGRFTANEYVQVNGYAVPGAGCSPNGLIGNSGAGPVFCQSGVWQTASGPRIHFNQVSYQYVGDGGLCPPNTVVIGAGGWYATYTAGYLYCAAYY